MYASLLVRVSRRTIESIIPDHMKTPNSAPTFSRCHGTGRDNWPVRNGTGRDNWPVRNGTGRDNWPVRNGTGRDNWPVRNGTGRDSKT